MTNYIKNGLIVLAVGAVYIAGYSHAEYKGELAIEEIKQAHTQAIFDAQEKEKAKYEKDIASLVASLERLRNQHDDRLHELEDFRNAGRDMETCRRERNDLATVAVGLEKVATTAIIYLEGGDRK